MKKIATIAAACIALSSGLFAVGKEKPVYFDYEEFSAIRALDPNMSEARLCGMNKACMKLWKNGEMLATEHGMVVRADFDGDGSTAVGVAMEKDRPGSEHAAPGAEEQLDYYMVMARHSKDNTYSLMQTVPLRDAHNVVECSWEDRKHAIAVDVGERQLISQSTVTMLGDGKLLGGLSKKTGELEMRMTYLTWDAKAKKFDTSHGTIKL